MGRFITKEIAVKIKEKLCDIDLTKPKSPHDVFGIRFEGKIVGVVSIRRGSEKDKGHDYIPKDINVSPGFAKQIGICNKNLDDYLQCLREKGLLPEKKEAPETK
jgi:hypothetical protein